ncbi:MAG TPA: hypothetical protein VKV23_10535 [Acidimicrobiales bacterium]|nr:hypothetical protein [Acidimicrobiales bacterium]
MERERVAAQLREEGAELVEEAEALEEHAAVSLRRLFADRRLSVRTMDRPLRVASAGALAAVLATCAFVVLRDVGGAGVPLGTSNGAPTMMATPVFVAVLALVSIGFGYVFTAVATASARVAVPTMLLLLFLVGLYTGSFGQLIGGLDLMATLPRWAPWVARGLLAVILALALAVQALEARAGRAPGARRARLGLLAAFSLLTAGYFFSQRVASPTIGGLNLFGPVISLILGFLVFLMYPILQVAAVDFGEWGELVGRRLVSVAGSSTWRLWLLAAATAAATSVLGGFEMAAGGPRWPELALHALRGTVLLGVVLAGTAVIGVLLRARARPRELSFATLVAVSAVSAVLVPPFALWLGGGLSHVAAPSLTTPSGTFAAGADVVVVRAGVGSTAFSFQVPRGWAVRRLGDAAVVVSNYDGRGGFERVLALEVPVPADLPLIARTLKLDAGPARVVGHLEVADFTAAALRGVLWVEPFDRPTPGTYVIEAQVHGGFTLAGARPLFLAVVHSFRGFGERPAALPPPAETASSQASQDKQLALDTGLTAALAAAAVALVALRRRRAAPQLVGGALLLVLVALFDAAVFATDIGHYLFGAHVHLPSLDVAGTVFGCGVLGLGVLAVARAAGWGAGARGRRLVAGVVALEAAVAALRCMYWLYGRALSASRISIWAAIVLLVAVTWDVAMSGESLTNRSTAHLPRATRLLAVYGYAILLAGNVLFYSAEKVTATGRAAESLFEPEAITQDALFRFALPVLFLVLLFEVAGDVLRRQATARAPAGLEAGGAPPGG